MLRWEVLENSNDHQSIANNASIIFYNSKQFDPHMHLFLRLQFVAVLFLFFAALINQQKVFEPTKCISLTLLDNSNKS